MEYVLGIDSGGTHFRVMAADLHGDCLGYYEGKPVNLHYLDTQELLLRMNENIDRALSQFSGERKGARYLVCGTTGIDCDEDQRLLSSYYKGLSGMNCPMKIMNDSELAHYTVTGGLGVLVISGTGSIAYGVNRRGETARAGGWPLSIFGDEGSGTWVTQKALRHYGRYLDQAAESSPLTERILAELNIKTRDDLIQAALSGGRNPAGFPKLGVLVNQAAAAGDPHAKEILEGAAAELVHLVEDVVCALNLEREEPGFSVGVWGSNIVKSSVVLGRFTELLEKRFPRTRLVTPCREAVEGAVEIALRCCGSRS